MPTPDAQARGPLRNAMSSTRWYASCLAEFWFSVKSTCSRGSVLLPSCVVIAALPVPPPSVVTCEFGGK